MSCKVPAQRHAVTILKNLYGFLVDQNYLMGNPWSAVSVPRTSGPKVNAGRSFSLAQWAFIEGQLKMLPETSANERLSFGLHLLYATGLRLSEVEAATVDDLQWVEYPADASDDQAMEGWLLRVVGKGQKEREVPLPSDLVGEMGRYRTPAWPVGSRRHAGTSRSWPARCAVTCRARGSMPTVAAGCPPHRHPIDARRPNVALLRRSRSWRLATCACTRQRSSRYCCRVSFMARLPRAAAHPVALSGGGQSTYTALSCPQRVIQRFDASHVLPALPDLSLWVTYLDFVELATLE